MCVNYLEILQANKTFYLTHIMEETKTFKLIVVEENKYNEGYYALESITCNKRYAFSIEDDGGIPLHWNSRKIKLKYDDDNGRMHSILWDYINKEKIKEYSKQIKTLNVLSQELQTRKKNKHLRTDDIPLIAGQPFTIHYVYETWLNSQEFQQILNCYTQLFNALKKLKNLSCNSNKC